MCALTWCPLADGEFFFQVKLSSNFPRVCPFADAIKTVESLYCTVEPPNEGQFWGPEVALSSYEVKNLLVM